MITVLAGGVGAARFIQGLVQVIPTEELNIIVNTGDDIELYDLHISPDIDTIMYTLSNMVDSEKGWGMSKDTFNCLETLERFGLDTWFKLGDKDLATHIYRTHLLNKGLKLSEVTEILSKKIGLKPKIIPMTDDKVTTTISTDKSKINFQEYFVKRSAKDIVVNVEFEGITKARPSPKVIESILSSEAIIVCPSNPIVSIGTIISLKGVREALKSTKAKIVGISPIVGGLPIKGPADKLMSGLNIEVSAYGVACLYKDFLDIYVIDNIDVVQIERISTIIPKVVPTNTIMRDLNDKIALAKTVLELIK